MTTHDKPWRRPGAFAYARRRVRALVRPPVEVYETPADVVKHHDVAVTMADGVVLRVNVYRPRGDGPFPVILCAHPYGKDALPSKKRRGWSFSPQYRIMNQPQPVRFSDQTSWEAPDPAWWVAHGYAVVNADTRGGGHSDGVGDLFSDQEAHDIFQLIEWAGSQPWSSGNVGMLGVSYLAISQYKAAALHPPALKAICPWEGFTDAYRDIFTTGGIPENGFARIWLFMTKRVARVATDLAAGRREHPLRDEWWEALTPDLADITVPMLVCASFSDDNLHSVGSMRAFQRVASKDRFAYVHRGPKWATFYGEDARRVQLEFFDRYLKAADAPRPPRMRLEIRDTADHVVEVRSEDEWPLARTQWTALRLGDGGALHTTHGALHAADAADYAPTGSVTFDLRRDAALFRHDFAEDTEITGPMTLRLWVSSAGTDDPHLFVGVEKWSGSRYVPFEGSYGYGRDRVASGMLRVAMRELDEELSTPHQPEHTFRKLEPVDPGQVVEVLIPLTSSATLFRAGESLRLFVAGRFPEPGNPFFGHFPARYTPSRAGKATIHWSAERPSALEIPVIPWR
ncbi:CocE/NonD family hydrolase [Humibacter sp.]|uniref:CocE/NonD family hydrolase n=1 Tax=Humibacter sp. TaxID=1940291 RepID=UPI002BA1FBDD|nr:CocE/NonD family hydrolase [Humibacter sp.]HVX06862.1 CocE/NonD family hydrolase [Humibacter sp.]